MLKTVGIHIRVTPLEDQAWTLAARTDGRTMTDWIRRRCNGQPATGPVFEPLPAPPPRKPRTKR